MATVDEAAGAQGSGKVIPTHRCSRPRPLNCYVSRTCLLLLKGLIRTRRMHDGETDLFRVYVARWLCGGRNRRLRLSGARRGSPRLHQRPREADRNLSLWAQGVRDDVRVGNAGSVAHSETGRVGFFDYLNAGSTTVWFTFSTERRADEENDQATGIEGEAAPSDTRRARCTKKLPWISIASATTGCSMRPPKSRLSGRVDCSIGCGWVLGISRRSGRLTLPASHQGVIASLPPE